MLGNDTEMRVCQVMTERAGHLSLQSCYSATMNVAQFRDSLSGEQPPRGLSCALAGLWWDAKGEWTRAHESAQQDEGSTGAWVHAYLHRVEGDLPNARWWYNEAKRPAATGSLDDEWSAIVRTLLNED